MKFQKSEFNHLKWRDEIFAFLMVFMQHSSWHNLSKRIWIWFELKRIYPSKKLFKPSNLIHKSSEWPYDDIFPCCNICDYFGTFPMGDQTWDLLVWSPSWCHYSSESKDFLSKNLGTWTSKWFDHKLFVYIYQAYNGPKVSFHTVSIQTQILVQFTQFVQRTCIQIATRFI